MIFEDFDFDSILSDEKSFQNFSIYDILYKTLSGVRPLRIKFEKVDRFIRNYDGTRYLVQFGPEKYDGIYNRIRYNISQKLVLRMFFLKIIQGSKFTHVILCLYKKNIDFV